MSRNIALDVLVENIARMKSEADRINFTDSDRWFDLGMDDIVAGALQAARAQASLDRHAMPYD
jgi:hypothetical protein